MRLTQFVSPSASGSKEGTSRTHINKKALFWLSLESSFLALWTIACMQGTEPSCQPVPLVGPAPIAGEICLPEEGATPITFTNPAQAATLELNPPGFQPEGTPLPPGIDGPAPIIDPPVDNATPIVFSDGIFAPAPELPLVLSDPPLPNELANWNTYLNAQLQEPSDNPEEIIDLVLQYKLKNPDLKAAYEFFADLYVQTHPIKDAAKLTPDEWQVLEKYLYSGKEIDLRKALEIILDYEYNSGLTYNRAPEDINPDIMQYLEQKFIWIEEFSIANSMLRITQKAYNHNELQWPSEAETLFTQEIMDIRDLVLSTQNAGSIVRIAGLEDISESAIHVYEFWKKNIPNVPLPPQ